MPRDFECPSCKLAFSVGWYHYHSDSGGFWARTLVVCRSCGTQHSIEHAARGNTAPEISDVLESYDAPLKNPKKLKIGDVELPSYQGEWLHRTSIGGAK